MTGSARQEDHNGWYEIKGNPLSKVGVFPYSGAQIGLEGEDATKVFQVLRPAEELSDPECIDSFKLLPWIDEHTLLGAAKDGLTPPEKKGIDGVIGEDVYFDGATDDGFLRGNVKVFSDKLAKLIEEGKRELSCGYRCIYDMTSGVFNGEKYDAIQREIRGNHLALVKEGRMGKEVAVLDHFTFTIDTKEAFMPDPIKKEEGAADDAVTLESLAAQVKEVMAFISKLKPIEEKEHGAALDDDGEEVAADKAKAVGDDDVAEDDACDDDKKGTMDSAKEIKLLQAKIAKLEKSNVVSFDSKTLLKEISQRDQLAQKLSHHIGTFDSAEMTLADVAKYGVKKLGIVCADGSEAAVLAGFLHGRSAQKIVAAADSAHSSEVDAFLAR